MRDLFKLFDRRYSAVNSNDTNASNSANNTTTEENLQYLQQIDFNQRQRKKSLQPTRSLKQGITIVDSFFNERKGGKRYPKCAFLLLAAGLCAIASGIAIFILQPYDAIFRWKLIFGEGGEIFSLWKNPPVDIYIKIYLWNITNSEAFLAGEEKMQVEEVGPYVYRKLLSHGDVTFNKNGTVPSLPRHPLVWDEERSKGHSEDDLFILPNIALLVSNCLPAGLLDISECYYGFPIALSYPHFLDTDETVAEHVVGMTPDRSKHETYFYVQPTSGLPLELSVKFQINMAMRDVSNMAHVEQFSNIVIPMLWFEITLEKLPDSLMNRFNLYLNVLPIVVDVSQYGSLVLGVLMLVYAVTRVSMKLSVQSSRKISRQRKYSSIYPDMIQRFGDVEKVFELNEKSRKSSISRADLLYDVDMNSEKKFMLDEEPAISEDDGTDTEETDSRTNSDGASYKNSEIVSLKTNSTDTTMPFDGWTMGATSSCLNDIANDDFPQHLHINEAQDESDSDDTDKCDYHKKTPMLRSKSNTLQIPEIKTSTSDNSLSHFFDSASSSANSGTNSLLTVPTATLSQSSPNMSEMKSSGSDVSISFFLDREDAGEAFDEHTFANVNAEPTRRRSNVNVTFVLDDQE